ncbi:ATP-binding protein [Staphylococcus aureus]|uniref:ATP-binding protein n=1 Tax=Staphylococcus aureus TaxID=1280 RepID=UPI0024A92943|nr:ATP-binding protein [Staphylococcus aureus]
MAIFKYIEEKGYEGKYTILREYCKNKIQNETKKITFFEDNINICFLDNRVVGKTHLTISLGIEACKQIINRLL